MSSPLVLYRRTISYASVHEVASPSELSDIGQLQSSAQKEPMGGPGECSFSSEVEGSARSRRAWEKSSDGGTSAQLNRPKSSSAIGMKDTLEGSLLAVGVSSLMMLGVGSISF